ncbi:hypothetical protein BDN72DRAFT_48760 [Pluteus cervinus]|uniref:Uncharacterized protein n=1 Tax=Pluteus cervinus TaxID=181527 RepID=A0ACD3BHL1_9AGAR|nr:hypothetical protein BDN72DRAFT_48760 [Pluteus cervinus]
MYRTRTLFFFSHQSSHLARARWLTGCNFLILVLIHNPTRARRYCRRLSCTSHFLLHCTFATLRLPLFHLLLLIDTRSLPYCSPCLGFLFLVAFVVLRSSTSCLSVTDFEGEQDMRGRRVWSVGLLGWGHFFEESYDFTGPNSLSFLPTVHP